MKKSNRWFWVKLFGPGLLALPWVIMLLLDFLSLLPQDYLSNQTHTKLIFLGLATQIVWASFFPKTSTNLLAKIVVTGGVIITYSSFILSINLDPTEIPGPVNNILSLTGFLSIFIAFLYYIRLRDPGSSSKRKILDTIRHLASILCVWVFLAQDLLWLMHAFDILVSDIQIRDILLEYPPTLLLIFFSIAGIGYYISSIWHHIERQPKSLDGLIEEIGG